MLVLPDFELLQPTEVDEAVAALSPDPGEVMLLAGGTDLVPNLKHGLYAPKRVVSLAGVSALRSISDGNGSGLFLGSGITLTELAAHPVVRSRYPALARAARLVAGPQLRNMGTLGGNLCLDTRCVYVNQTIFWRGALGHCIKKDGDVCHVVPKGSRCVAAFSADTPGPLIVYRAMLHLRSSRGERQIPALEFFRADGVSNTIREPDELLTGVTLPPPPAGLRSNYVKLRTRQSIDFPALSVAVAARMEKDRFQTLDLVVGAVTPKPRVVRRTTETVKDQPLTRALADAVGTLAYDQCRPLTTINVDPDWRREVLPVFVRRALEGMEASGD
jgi:4-hydroxybenzoyl-CoA reductase subunit beta